jgi:hypothetical protein
MLVAEQAIDAFVEEAAEPGIEGVGAARTEDAGAGDRVGRGAVSDPEQGSSAFTDEGLGMVVAVVQQLPPLLVGEVEGTALAHGRVLHSMLAPSAIIAPLLNLIGQVH